MSTYTIKAGDTLTSIARRFNVSIATIADTNGIDDPDVITAGDTLTIPDAPASAPVTLDQSGSVVSNVPANAPRPQTAVATLNLSEWFKPPKLYFLLAALAAGAYLLSKKERR